MGSVMELETKKGWGMEVPGLAQVGARRLALPWEQGRERPLAAELGPEAAMAAATFWALPFKAADSLVEQRQHTRIWGHQCPRKLRTA